MEIRVLGKTDVLLGEGPMWDNQSKTVKYIDILGRKQITLDLETELFTEISLPEDVGCMAKCSDGKYLFACTTAVFDEDFNEICKLPLGKGARFNDGKAAPDGKFVLGTTHKGGNGALFSLENGRLNTVIDGVRISNGLDWSKDENILYYCDTPTRKIVAYSYPDFKFVKTVIDFNDIKGFEGNPDGLCIDTDENLWIAIWGGGCVVKVNPNTSEILEKISLPAKYISCPAFVGEELNVLFLTSAKHDDDAKLAGRCFALNVNARGREPYKINVENITKR